MLLFEAYCTKYAVFAFHKCKYNAKFSHHILHNKKRDIYKLNYIKHI